MNLMEKYNTWSEKNTMKCRQLKKMILSLFAFSVLLYIVLIANQLTNHFDGLWSGDWYKAGAWELSIGRWLLLYIDRLRLGISTEPTASCLTLFLIVIGVMLILDMFDQIGKKTGYLAAMIILSNTVVSTYLSYRFTSPSFGAGFCLSIFAAWILNQKIRNWVGQILAASVVIMLSLGAYQANIACTCVLLVIMFIKMLLEDTDYNEISKYIFKCLVALMAGCIAYRVIWLLHLKLLHVSPSSYRGADSVSVIDMVRLLPQSAARAWETFFTYFFGSVFRHNIFQEMGFFYIIFLIVLALLLQKVITTARKNRIKAILVITAIVILPMACNASQFLAPKNPDISIQMTAGTAILFPTLLCLFNSTKSGYTGKISDKVHKSIYGLCIISYAFILYGNIYMTAIDQGCMYEGKNATETLVDAVIVKLQEDKMYYTDRPYIFIGRPSDNPMFHTTKLWSMANPYARYGDFWTSVDCLRNSYSGVLRNIGVNLPYGEDNIYTELIGGDYVRNMPCFPNDGCIQEINGTIVIKVSNTY